MDTQANGIPDWLLSDLLNGGSSLANNDQTRTDLQIISRHRRANGDSEGRLTSQQIHGVILYYIQNLPRLTEEDLDELGHRESSCAICLNTHLASLAEEEMAHVMDYPSHPVENLGVTRLSQTCGHIFCRKELSSLLILPDILMPNIDGCYPFLKPSSDTSPSDSNVPTAPNGSSEYGETAGDDDVFDQAWNRVMAAYEAERGRIRAEPVYEDMFGQSGSSNRGPFHSNTDEDRSAYVGMYS
ncbi:hypothetical protein OF83DRAFT_1174430 [Amylostereum chailletii]|nr:hypothetical protein OF83DRAFT_1174430 [Amylostereum chailletii]